MVHYVPLSFILPLRPCIVMYSLTWFHWYPQIAKHSWVQKISCKSDDPNNLIQWKPLFIIYHNIYIYTTYCGIAFICVPPQCCRPLEGVLPRMLITNMACGTLEKGKHSVSKTVNSNTFCIDASYLYCKYIYIYKYIFVYIYIQYT